MPEQRPLSALPSRGARSAAFISIIFGGLIGSLIGYALVDIQYDGQSSVPLGLGLLIGAVLTSGGTSIVAVLSLRALGEWRDLSDRT